MDRMRDGVAVAVVLLSACGESPQLYVPPTWQPPDNLPKAITAIDGRPTFFLDGDRVVAESRQWSFVTYGYDERGLLALEEHQAKAPIHVTYSYDELDRLLERDQIVEQDGVVANHTRKRYSYDETTGLLDEVVEETEQDDGSWWMGAVISYEYDEAGRLLEMSRAEPTDIPHDPMKARYDLCYTYDENGRLKDVERIGYGDDGERTAYQIRNLHWSKEGLLLSSRVLDEFTAFFYNSEGDLRRFEGMLLRRDRNSSEPTTREFTRADAPATFWYGPWNAGEGPEALINLFGRL